MAGQYHLKSFLRRTPNELLQRYLGERGVGEGLPWEHLAGKEIEPIFEAIEGAPEHVRRRVESECLPFTPPHASQLHRR